jgi:hypothetical protein
MSRTKTFEALLLRTDRSPEAVAMPRVSATPPRVIRRPAGGTDALTFEVYALVDADGWPQSATFSYVESVVRASADPDI